MVVITGADNEHCCIFLVMVTLNLIGILYTVSEIIGISEDSDCHCIF